MKTEPKEIIDNIIDGLQGYPYIKFLRKRPDELELFASGQHGFNIHVYTGYKEHLIYLENFHWHFDNNEQDNTEMYDLIVRALVGTIRIQIFSYNGKEFKWVLQQQVQNGDWVDNMTTGTYNRKFHTTPDVYYLQNNINAK